jgi:oligopeptide/dipeptide ABC transporter ATP-binding protein
MTTPKTNKAVLDLRDVTVQYRRRGHEPFTAVENVSFTIGSNETVGLVGESGSGKSTIGRAVLGLTDVTSGSVEFGGQDITHWTNKQRRTLSAALQVVFQDPYSSLNPTRTIGQTLADSLYQQRREFSNTDVSRRLSSTLERVGLPADAANRYPGHFSGGQRQRIAIARALMGQPKLVICDEPVSALDLSVQAQVLNLLNEIQENSDLSYLFISHDLTVVRHISHRLIVLYRGTIMEHGAAEEIYLRPSHPYTRALLEAAAVPDPAVQRARRRARPTAVDAVPQTGKGCAFTSRCPFAVEECRQVRPLLEKTPAGVDVACHRWREVSQ